MIAYINTKLLYLEGHEKEQLEMLYDNLAYQSCLARKQSLETLVITADHSPELFAKAITGQLGFTSVTVGDVVYILECKKVQVFYRSSQSCYKDLPVYYNNKSMFISAQTHTISNLSYEIPCHPIFSSKYLIGDSWFTSGTALTEVPGPSILDPNSNQPWSYDFMEEIGSRGLYTEKDIAQWSDTLLFQRTREAVKENLVNLAVGYGNKNFDLRYEAFAPENYLKDTAKKWSKTTWDHLSSIGSVGAGLMMIFGAFKLLKMTIETMINGYSLFEVFGWSFKLLGSIFHSITTWLLLKEQKKDISANHNEQRGDIPLIPTNLLSMTLESPRLYPCP